MVGIKHFFGVTLQIFVVHINIVFVSFTQNAHIRMEHHCKGCFKSVHCGLKILGQQILSVFASSFQSKEKSLSTVSII